MLLVLLAASALIFVIACSNVANLILARSVRRESELAVRAALGASASALRKTLLAESLVVCVSGALLGVLIAQPMVSVLGRYAARFSVRALELTLDSSLLWVGVALAATASVLLAFVPKLPSSDAARALSASSSGTRITSGTSRRLRAFAITQIAASFVLLAGAGVLVRTLLTLQAARPGFRTTDILAVNVPVSSFGRTPEQVRGVLPRPDAAHRGSARRAAGRHRQHGAVARCRARWARDSSSRWKGASVRTARRIRAASSARCRPASSPRSASRSSPDVISTRPIGWAPSASSSSARASCSGCSRTPIRSTAS